MSDARECSALVVSRQGLAVVVSTLVIVLLLSLATLYRGAATTASVRVVPSSLVDGGEASASALRGFLDLVEVAERASRGFVDPPTAAPTKRSTRATSTPSPVVRHFEVPIPPEAAMPADAADPLEFLARLPPIPHKIHLTWKTHSILNSDLAFVLNGIRNLVDLNPDWVVTLSNDSEVDAYLQEKLAPSDWELLRNRHVVEKSDTWRLTKMYYEGGYYQDVDLSVNVAMSEVCCRANDTVRMWLPTHFDTNFAQDKMLTAPGNPMFKHALAMNLKWRRDGKYSILDMGPGAYVYSMAHFLLPPDEVTPHIRAHHMVKMRAVIARSRYARTMVEGSGAPLLLHRGAESGLRIAPVRSGRPGGKRELYAESQVHHWAGAFKLPGQNETDCVGGFYCDRTPVNAKHGELICGEHMQVQCEPFLCSCVVLTSSVHSSPVRSTAASRASGTTLARAPPECRTHAGNKVAALAGVARWPLNGASVRTLLDTAPTHCALAATSHVFCVACCVGRAALLCARAGRYSGCCHAGEPLV